MIDFLELLSTQTDNGTVRWTDIHGASERILYELYRVYIDDYNSKVTHKKYVIEPTESAFAAKRDDGDIVFATVTNGNKQKCFLICVRDDSNNMNEIVLATPDQTGSVYSHCKELFDYIHPLPKM